MAKRHVVERHCCNNPSRKRLPLCGAHINTTKVRKVATADARVDKARVQLGRIAKLKAEADKQASIIRTKIHTGAFYGIEAADYTDRQLADMTIVRSTCLKTQQPTRRRLVL